MELLKFALGPYELFASVLGGLPLVLATFLLYNPAISLRAWVLLLQSSFSLPLIVLVAFFSYFLGTLIQGFSWKYFLALSRLLNQDFYYLSGPLIATGHARLKDVEANADLTAFEFEDRLILLLREKVGIPKKISWIYSRIYAYLKENGSPSVLSADLYQASHIMLRSISFGMLVVGGVILLNLFRVNAFSWEQLALALAAVALAYVAFLRSSSFKRWHSRDLLLGFYFAASKER